MPFTDTRLGPGTLKLGATPGTEFGFQVANIVLTPNVTSEDGTPTLAVPDPAPSASTDYTLDGDAIQDFSAAAGLQRYCFDNDLTEVPFDYVSNTEPGKGAHMSGTVQIRAFPMGGDVGTGPITTSFSWPVVGKPTIADVTAEDAAAASSEARKASAKASA